MNAGNLLKIYEEQLKNMDELLKAAVDKQKSIIQNNRVSLEKETKKEETVLSKINRKEVERLEYLQRLFAGVGKGKVINISEFSEEQLLTRMSEDELNEFTDLRGKIKELTSKVLGVNQQNKFLIEQANSIVKNVLETILKSQKKPLVDRRV